MADILTRSLPQTPADWRVLLAEHGESGLSARAFCAAQGIPSTASSTGAGSRSPSPPPLEVRDAAWSACLETVQTQAKAQIDTFRTEVEQLKAQLDWFKRQLFGQKSKVDPAHQPSLDLEGGSPELTPEEVPTEEVTYTRPKLKKRPEDCVTDSGLRFDDSVPVQTIEVKAPERKGPDADQYEVID